MSLPGAGAGSLVAVGETMALVAPRPARPLASAESFVLEVAGAESNVACGASQLGFPAAWVSRLGVDALGERVLDRVASYGVDVSRVTRDTDRVTGLLVKSPGDTGTEVVYYRSGSAASALGIPDLERIARAAEGAILHVTGVTPALSESCRELTAALLGGRNGVGAASVSFDVNHRPRLWRDRDAAAELAAFARASDTCFVGLDEAAALWGTRTARDVRRHLAEPRVLVVKDGGREVTAFVGQRSPVVVRALPVDVVEPVGAGDGFAAGFLAAVAADVDVRGAVRVGHMVAARVLRTVGDVADLPGLDAFSDVVGADERDWDEMVSMGGAGWTR